MALHPPKVEIFDVAAGTNTDPKGFVRAVDVYIETDSTLYLSRPMVDHPTLTHLVSWLLPALGLRVTEFTWRPGHEKPQDWYVDIVDVARDDDGCWRTQDHYLDLAVRAGVGTELLDVDEYVEAVAHGLLAPDAAERALHASHRALAGLAAHAHDLAAWLATLGVPLDRPKSL